MTKSEVVIVSATRTPIGSFCGNLSSLKAHELGSIAIKSAITRANISPNDVTNVILGQALQAGQGQNPARQAAINAGLPHTTTATGVNMLCGSGLKAVALAYQELLADGSSIVVAGGQESMSQAPHVIPVRSGIKMGNGQLTDSMVFDGLTDAFHNIHMGITAENIAREKEISRENQDNYATESQARAGVAISMGRFNDEITPVTVKTRKDTTIVDKDEYPKPETTIATLSKLRPAFLVDGTVTAGNASGINDGAAALVVMSADGAAQRNIKPLVRIVGSAEAGVDPKVMGLGPIPAIKKLLNCVGWKAEDVDLYELNEAFAVQSLAVVRELGLDPAKVNVNGGAIALGHPIGASGARILVTLIHALKQRQVSRGVAALCIGGGMGIAMAVETI